MAHTNPVRDEEDKALRPDSLSDFIGQESLKEKLAVSIAAARKRVEPLDHVLFSGPPGLGKTTLAAIIASEMGSRFHATSAPALSKPGDLAKILTVLESGDVLFLDEIHRLPSQCEEILYPAMEDGYIDLVISEGIAAQSIKLPLKPFTLIGATTRSGMLSAPLKSRFGIDLKLVYYAPEEIARIVLRSARLLAIEFDAEAAQEVGKRSRMTPRIANRLVRRIRDYATVEGIDLVTREFASRCLASLGVDELGLTELDRRMLSLMIERYRGGPVGIRTLASHVDEEERTLEEDHEPFLMRVGLWDRTPRGRIVTGAGFAHMGAPVPLGWGALGPENGKGDEPQLF